MAFKIDMGMFRGSIKQIVSRFTWELSQTVFGYTAATVQNTMYGVKSVSYYGGATAVENYSGGWGAFTLGSYIIGNRGLHADPDNVLFLHEYGHYLQSQSFGPFYIQRFGIPSLFDSMRSKESKSKHPHNDHPVEQDANIRAYKYFMEHVEGYGIKNWDFDSNGIIGYDKSLPYDDSVNQTALDRTMGLSWADYVFNASIIVPTIFNNNSLWQRP